MVLRAAASCLRKTSCRSSRLYMFFRREFAVFLSVDHSLRSLGVPLPLQRNPGSGAFNLAEIALGEFDISCRHVFLQAMELRRSWNRNDPRLLGQEPGECDLGGRRVLALSDAAE
jgi:hypothetical protein